MVDDPLLHETVALRPIEPEVQRLFEEFIAQHERGESPSVDEFTERHPHLADDLRRRLGSQPSSIDSKATDIDATCIFDRPPPAATPSAIEQLGDYRVLREIGRGGMGVVYEAEQESLGRRVALKVLLASAVADSLQQGRFEREARSAAKLHHTNIVPVFGVGQCDGTHYYVMQFIVGRGLDSLLADLRWLARHRQALDLEAVLNTRNDLSTDGDRSAVGVAEALLSGRGSLNEFLSEQKNAIDEAHSAAVDEHNFAPIAEGARNAGDRRYWCSVARLGAQVADALAYAHEQGILHRDIKPANLLLDGKGTVWVADFGLAKAVENDHLTQTGDIVGTLRYMPPEAFRGKYDARSDTYALGLTLYELITLRSPFDARDRNDLMHKVAHPSIEPLRRHCPSVPGDLETIVLKSLERDPEHRYATAGDMADDLQRFLRDEPIHARRASVSQRLARWYRHNPVVARLTAALVAVFIAGFAGVTWKWREAERQKVEIAAARNDAVAQREQAMEAKEEANRQASVAETINNFLVDDLLASAAPEKARGHKITVEEVLRQVGPKIENAIVNQPEVEASVRSTVGTTLYRLGLYDDAEPQLRRALELREQELGPDASDTLAALNNLAQTLKALGRLPEAEPLYRRSVEARQRTLGADDPETLGALNNLAQLLQAQGRLADAEPLYHRSLDAHRRKFGADDSDTLLAEGALGALWQQQGRTAEAEPVLRRVSQRLAEKIGKDHPHTLAAMHNLASLLQAAGKRDEAEQLFGEVLESCRSVLGPEHPETITTLNQLATLLHDEGKLPEAEKLVRQQLETSEQVLGSEHPQTLVARHNLSRLLQSQGKASEAEPLARENVAASQRVLGPEHPDTLQAESGLAMVFQSQGKFAEAELLLREVLDTQRRVLGDDHPHTLISINNLAVNMQALGKIAEAEPLVRENLEACRRVLGPDHPDTLLATSAMAQLLMSEGKWSEAEPIARSSLDAHRRVLGPDHPETLNAADDVVTLLLALDKLAEAGPLVADLVAARRRVLGPNHPDTLKSLGTLAMILSMQAHYEAAEPVLRETVAIREQQNGPNAPETLAALRSLALAVRQQDRSSEAKTLLRDLLNRAMAMKSSPAIIADAQVLFAGMLLDEHQAAEAEPLLREAVETDRRVLAEGHAQTAQAESALGAALTELERYDEAESLLLGAFGVLNVKRGGQTAAQLALDRIVALYERWKKSDEATEWRSKLSRRDPPDRSAATK